MRQDVILNNWLRGGAFRDNVAYRQSSLVTCFADASLEGFTHFSPCFVQPLFGGGCRA